MTTTRLEAFSDGVIAILITIMILELKVPEADGWEALHELVKPLSIYVLSFVFLGIYWSNHHHMIHITSRVNGAILWANLHLLFWLSLVPFVTAWMDEKDFTPLPTAAYGVVLLLAAIAYYILQQLIIAAEGPGSKLAEAVGGDLEGRISPVLYLIAVPSAFLSVWIAIAIYAFVALMWLVPDRRIERKVSSPE